MSSSSLASMMSAAVDPGQRLGVEQQQADGDADGQSRGVVSDVAAKQGEAALLGVTVPGLNLTR
jgi:hypothetical protein